MMMLMNKRNTYTHETFHKLSSQYELHHEPPSIDPCYNPDGHFEVACDTYIDG